MDVRTHRNFGLVIFLLDYFSAVHSSPALVLSRHILDLKHPSHISLSKSTSSNGTTESVKVGGKLKLVESLQRTTAALEDTRRGVRAACDRAV